MKISVLIWNINPRDHNPSKDFESTKQKLKTKIQINKFILKRLEENKSPLFVNLSS